MQAATQPLPTSEYFGNAYNSTEASLGTVALTNTTQLIDMRFTARYSGDAVPRLSVGIDYFNISAKYDVVIGVQADAEGKPSGHFLGAFVWNVTSGLCNGCGGWVFPGFAPESYSLNHTITLAAGTVYHLVVKYFNGTLTYAGGCYGTDCLVIEYIGGTNFRQESQDMQYDPNQALLACGNIDSCDVVPGANAVYALGINGSVWSQGQTESILADRPIGAAKGGTGLDSFQGERFWMAWNSVTVSRLQVFLSKTGAPSGSLNLLIWNFTASSPGYILGASNPQLMLNQSVIPNLGVVGQTTDRSYNFSLTSDVTFEYGHMYQISFAIYGNTTTIDGANEAAVEATNSNYDSNPLNWDGGDGSRSESCPQLTGGCAGFRYASSTDNAASEATGYEDLVFIAKVVSTAVTQPISVQLSNSAPAALISVDGCHASPSTFSADGAPHAESMDPSCAFSLSYDNIGDIRDGFAVAGAFSATSGGQTSCQGGACPELSLTAFEQVANTFRADPATPVKWDADLQIAVNGTQLGSQNQTGCTISTVAGNQRVDCQAWFDYGTVATVANPVVVSSSERWFAPGQVSFGQRTGGNTYTAGYVDQFNVSFAVSPAGSGTTSPTNSSLWESYGSISLNATAAHGFGFASWEANAAGIALSDAGSPSATAAIQGAGTITATFARLVTQPIAISTPGQGGQKATFMLSGCEVSPTSITANGTTLSFNALPSCSIIVTSPTGGQGLRYSFDSGGIPSSTISVPTCSEGSCQAFSSTDYEQVSETFALAIVGGGAPSYPSVSFTSLGADATQPEGPQSTKIWLDLGTRWSVTEVLPGSSQAERWVAFSSTAGVALLPGNETTGYQHQYSVSIAASPSDCGTTTPSGATWEPAGTVFVIEVSGSGDCAFNAWNASSGISIAQQGGVNSTVSALAPGTITASFTIPLLASPSSGVPVIYIEALVGSAVVVVCVVLVARRLSQRARTYRLPAASS